jgi:hypothetical protein
MDQQMLDSITHEALQEQLANTFRQCLWRPDHAGFDLTSIFDAALVEK